MIPSFGMPRDDKHDAFDSDETPTEVDYTCRACGGKGLLLLPAIDSGTRRAVKCAWCGGAKIMTKERLAAWKATHEAPRRK